MADEIMLAITVIGIVAPFISIVTWQIFRERHEIRRLNYNKWAKRYERKTGVKTESLPREQKGIGELVAGLDRDKISNILNALQEDEDEEHESGGDEIGNLIGRIVQDNPELVASFLGGLKGGTPKKDDSPSQV